MAAGAPSSDDRRWHPSRASTASYSFDTTTAHIPAPVLVQATDDNLYGTTSKGGWGGPGPRVRLTTNGGL